MPDSPPARRLLSDALEKAMNLHNPIYPPKPQGLFGAAVTALRAAGHRVEPAPGVIPGLCHIDGGPELTMGQVIDVARQKGLLG